MEWLIAWLIGHGLIEMIDWMDIQINIIKHEVSFSWLYRIGNLLHAWLVFLPMFWYFLRSLLGRCSDWTRQENLDEPLWKNFFQGDRRPRLMPRLGLMGPRPCPPSPTDSWPQRVFSADSLADDLRAPPPGLPWCEIRQWNCETSWGVSQVIGGPPNHHCLIIYTNKLTQTLGFPL